MDTNSTEVNEVLDDLQIVADYLGCSLKEAEMMVPLLKEAMGSEQDAPVDAPKEQEDSMEDTAKPSEKIKCKCCGFYKKPRKVLRDTGICGVCTSALSESDGTVEVVGRMGKRGRNNVSVVIGGRRWKVKRLSNRHSENVAKKYAAKPKGYAKKSKRTSAEPVGIRTDSRIGDDRVQRTHED